MSVSAISGIIASSQFFVQALEDSPGLAYLQANAKVFYDFTRLEGIPGNVIDSSDDGLLDLGPGGYDASPGGSVEVGSVIHAGQEIKGILDTGSMYIDTGTTGNDWFDSSFEIIMLVDLSDGIPVENIDLAGVTDGSDDRLNLFITSTGQIRIHFKTDVSTFVARTPGAVFNDGDTGLITLRIKYDYETETFMFEKDGIELTHEVISVSMSNADPANYSSTRNIYIGSNNSVGTPTSNNNSTNHILRFAITPILTDQEASDVLSYIGSFNPPVAKPNVQASLLLIDETDVTASLSWQRGNGSHCIVVARTGSAVDSFPVDGISYTANSVFGSGDEIGTGNFVVFSGTGNNVIVTGLPADTEVFFDVYEFNIAGPSYLTTIDTNTARVRTDVFHHPDFSDYATEFTEEGSGYTTTIANGELIIDGEPLGYLANIVKNDGPGDTLEEFELRIKFRINDDPTTGTPGIGIGIKNDLTTEANRGVLGLFVTKTDSDNFGTVQIYAGNGTVNASGYTFKSQAGTGSKVTDPATGREYLMVFKRELIGNNAFYSITIRDLEDGTISTCSWTEIDRPSSAFFATSTRFFIYQNGGEYAVDYLAVKRVGDDVTPPPPPIDFDVYVTLEGSDTSGDGSIGNPYRTVNKGLSAVQALGGSVGSVDLSVGPGVFVEGSFLAPPNNLGNLIGSGKGVTEIRGTSNLNFNIDAAGSGERSNTNGFLINLIRSSTTNVNMTIKGMTLNGGGNGVPNTNNAIKGAIMMQKINGVTIEDVEIKHFNTSGIRLAQVDSANIIGCDFLETSGGTGTFGYYQIEMWNVGGGTPLGNADGNFQIVIDNCTFSDMRVGGDQLIGFTGGPGGNEQPQGNLKYITNLEIKNSTFNLDYTSSDNEGHRFCIEGLYMTCGNVWIHDNFFNSNLSFGGLGGLTGGNDAARGKTRVSHNTFGLDPGAHSFVIEMQISNIEIDNNFISGILGAHNGCFVILNTQETFGNAGHAPMSRTDHGNWNIHHNIIECNSNSYGDGVTGAARWDVKGLNFEHNTVIFRSSSGQPWYGIIISNGSGHQMTGLNVRSNLFIGQPASGSLLLDPNGGLSGAVVSHNFTSHLTINGSRTGATFSNNQGAIGGNLGIPLSGTKPTTRDQAFSGNYFRPISTSVLKNAAHDGTTVGALTAL